MRRMPNSVQRAVTPLLGSHQWLPGRHRSRRGMAAGLRTRDPLGSNSRRRGQIPAVRSGDRHRQIRRGMIRARRGRPNPIGKRLATVQHRNGSQSNRRLANRPGTVKAPVPRSRTLIANPSPIRGRHRSIPRETAPRPPARHMVPRKVRHLTAVRLASRLILTRTLMAHISRHQCRPGQKIRG